MRAAAGLDAQGKAAEARRLYREIVDRRPEYAPAWAALAFHAFRQGDGAEAVRLTERCVTLDPGSALHWRNLCEFRRRAGSAPSAVVAGRRAVELSPADPEAYHNLSLALGDADQIADAIAIARRLLEIAPGHGRGWNNLGHWLTKVGRPEEARLAFQRAVDLEPNNKEARLNLATIEEALQRRAAATPTAAPAAGRSCVALTAQARQLWSEGRQRMALPLLEEALALEPDNLDALGLCATCHADIGDDRAAMRLAERALALSPGNPAVTLVLGVCQLNLGLWQEGWKNYEMRFAGAHEVISGRRNFPKLPLPQWKGEAGTERQSILVLHEQGFGDSIQFCRYLLLLRHRFARVGLLAPPELLRLMDASFGAEVVVLGNHPADYVGWDWHCRMLSLPFAFGTLIETLPCPRSYLRASAPTIEYWRVRLAQAMRPGLKIGLSWTGRPDHRFNRERSLAFEALQPLLAIEGANFVSLQRHEDVARAPVVPPGTAWMDWMPEMGDFSSTAALISNLDLVIGIDSVIVHLAGALGVPVWMMDRRNSEFRWMAPREDSPWYPTMRIFRQSTLGEWSDVVARVADALRALRDSG